MAGKFESARNLAKSQLQHYFGGHAENSNTFNQAREPDAVPQQHPLPNSVPAWPPRAGPAPDRPEPAVDLTGVHAIYGHHARDGAPPANGLDAMDEPFHSNDLIEELLKLGEHKVGRAAHQPPLAQVPAAGEESLTEAQVAARSGRRAFQPPPRCPAPAPGRAPAPTPARPRQPTPEEEYEDQRRQRARNKRGRQASRRGGGDPPDDHRPAGDQEPPGFQTAKSKLADELRKGGHAAEAAALEERDVAGLKVNGLRRGGGQGAAGTGTGSKFLPPYLKKALQSTGGGGGGGEETEGVLSQRTMTLLRLNPGEALPDELAKLDLQLVEAICHDVVDSGGGVSWDDIAGQEAAKKLIQEVIVWPMLNPAIFQGVRAPPRGVLLFGPPGTGKTLLGRAVASNIQAAFFSISASSLTSKWIGEGEKMVRTLFAVAGWLAPAVIFIDEVDSILSARKAEGEHEASRRLKTELLIQMEGCDPSAAARRVLLIGATNRPEELDEAARRRMPKQLYIPLPCAEARRAMVQRALRGVRSRLDPSELDRLVARTAGYSGSDMRGLVAEACAGPVREAVAAAAGAGAPGSGVAALREDDLRPVSLRDFQVAARSQRPSVQASEVERYEQYNALHGARLAGGAAGAEPDEEDW
uniref:AAA+ ATPase domain-containing protein n=1 Tax=Auxenochlorella protothecoides TaxID=3075 RepID=A0A1D2AH56_AUXPR